MPRRGVDEREVGEVIVGPEFEEQPEDLVEDLERPGVGAVDLVDDDHRQQPGLERLGKDEPGLGHRPLGGIDEDEGPVGHPQHPLHLAAEVGVAGGVDDVDLRPLPVNGDVLGEDRDPPLPLEVVGVEDPLAGELAGAELPALSQQAVDERRLAMIDVCDDGDVTDVGTAREWGGGGVGGGGAGHGVLPGEPGFSGRGGCARRDRERAGSGW